jgi:glycine amidinotransferase
MTYSVYQHWDPLKVCVVGKSYPPELYDYIKNEKIRKVFYKIAEETEEDYQKLISILERFNVKVIRPDITSPLGYAKEAIENDGPGASVPNPFFMQPRDHTIMIGEKYFVNPHHKVWHNINQHIIENNNTLYDNNELLIGDRIEWHNTALRGPSLANGAMTTRVGKDLYIGTHQGIHSTNILENLQGILEKKFPDNRIHIVDTQGHNDGYFCPAVPGLIFSIISPLNYKETFPDWEVVYLENESWSKMQDFIKLKKKNYGKWWVPGEELNDDFTNFVETWMNHWVGYVEESVFDVNMLMIDKKNAIVNGYNKLVFDAFDRYGITPHICNFRHRYFWDGGLHCITSDLHREGVMEDYFPKRG